MIGKWSEVFENVIMSIIPFMLKKTTGETENGPYFKVSTRIHMLSTYIKKLFTQKLLLDSL